MRPALGDHKVPLLYELQVKEKASFAREVFGVQENTFNVADCFRFLTRNDPFNRGLLKIAYHKEADFVWPAYMEIGKNNVFHVKQHVWEEMDEGTPEARDVGGHELGHLVLHDRWSQPFSGVMAKWISFDEESAEWQADKFDAHFLIPDSVVYQQILPRFVSMSCDITIRIARIKLGKSCGYIGECCSNCCNFTLVRGRYNLRCDTCGKYC